MDSSSIDFNSPERFFAALRARGSSIPIPKMISPEQVRKQAKADSKHIFKTRETLNAILDRHEPTIYKRWSKKSRNQRVQLLLTAWPRMSAAHRPDFLAFTKESPQQREAGTKYRDAYMWPHINLEDLTAPKALPLFLQVRARNPPDVFALTDYNSAHLGYVTNAIVPAFLNEYTMMFKRSSNPEGYGTLVSWDDDDRALDWLTSGGGIHPGQGLIILEIQRKILDFLAECCRLIMHNIPVEALISEEFPIQAPVMLARETINGFASLGVMAAEAQYRVPANMDLLRLESLISARKRAAEDHVWSLREDPEYFANCLLEAKGHRLEEIKDKNGLPHPVTVAVRPQTFWQRIVGNILMDAHLGLEAWSEFHEQIKKIRKLQDKYQHKINTEADLPEEYLNALLTLLHYANQAAKGPKSLLKHHASASPGLRHIFLREIPKDPSSTMIRIVQKQCVKLEKGEADLIWLLRILWEDGHDLFLITLPTAMDELDRLLQSDPKLKAMVSPYIADIIADLSVVAEIIRQVNIYQPWAQTFETKMVDKDNEIKSGFARQTRPWSMLMDVSLGSDQRKIVQLVLPLDKFRYPVEKRRTKSNVETLRAAEQNLDAFWSIIDQNLRNKLKKDLERTALGRLLSQSKILQRTPEWVEPEKKDKKDLEMEISAIMKPLSELYFDREQKTERTIDHSTSFKKETAPKFKTKGVPKTSDEGNRAPLPATQHDEQSKFHLDPRSLKVFRTLFYTPSISATPGEVPWSDFLQAMMSTGFEPEKLYGSVWQFSPTNLDVERSIQFHEPHPSGKLPYRTARRFGRRLNRAYGWEAGMFQPKES